MIKDEFEIPDKNTERKPKKSLSARLRAVMWLYHEQETGNIDNDFEQFYEEQMEKAIFHYKNKLRPK